MLAMLSVIKSICACKIAALVNAVKSLLLSGLVLLVGDGGNLALAGAERAQAGPGSLPEKVLAEVYGWLLVGDFPAEEVEVVVHVARGIERYVEDVSGADGRMWMRSYVGTVVFHRATWLTQAASANLALPGGHIHVLEGFGGSIEPHTDLAHEVAHVLDNNLGGVLPATLAGSGPSDEMLRAVGGTPELCRVRFMCPWEYEQRVSGAETWPAGAYANTGVAEDFAEAFSYAVFFPERVPEQRLEWIETFVASTAGALKPAR
jgi:hypothetical protein